MKTLRYFVVFTILLVLGLTCVNAQVQKSVTTQTLKGCWESLPCIGETLCGEIDFIHTVWSSPDQPVKKYQLQYSGYAVGQTSGDLYKIREIENTHGYFGTEGIAFNHNYVWTAMIHKEGGPAVVIHSMYHFTYDANGKIAVEFETFSTSCD
jgi:hypothetical protein